MSITVANQAVTVVQCAPTLAGGKGVTVRILRGTFVVVLVISSVVLPLSASEASVASNTFVLSGQEKGTLTLDTSKTCVAGNIGRIGAITTVRIFLTDLDIKPMNVVWFMWFMWFEAKSSKLKFPAAAPSAMTLGSNGGAGSGTKEWLAGATRGAGTVTFGRGFDSGVLNVNLDPAPYLKSATRAEKIVGRWSCL